MSDLSKPIKTVKNPFFFNNPSIVSEDGYTATVKCADSSKECKIQIKTEAMPSYAIEDEDGKTDYRLYLTSLKSGKFEVDLKRGIIIYPGFLTKNTIKVVGEPKDKVQIHDVADKPEDENKAPNEVTITGPGTAYGGLHENAGENAEVKATITYESTTEGDKLWFPDFAGWIPQKADLFTLGDLKNETSSSKEGDSSDGKLGGGAIAGIVIGVIVVVGIIVGVLVWLFVFKAKKGNDAEAP
ncbi:hypothetical protein TVAG_142170 [Trichomonas vaginalis G3]|uniref:Uncharacterized protein n=1 Tax=Trichomonas vaginalis (strain ATCC PRA-98 / G3) TaxID=412133 RepID=A2EHH6_TRIV3|nr:glycoprotein 38 family [Trichomonas vaginalis G3]EAY07863.1 hypothetical protein TVAG_142170 [Trichomonas vaginalis G3]KAI5514109.1 glycoprotein 38 family [Trichomonas vaginalis G3]|eukprot:XP_001320086.1 hypothetical protein [Trichomonas vaginalis G3]